MTHLLAGCIVLGLAWATPGAPAPLMPAFNPAPVVESDDPDVPRPRSARLAVRIESVVGEAIEGTLLAIDADGTLRYETRDGLAALRCDDVATITPLRGPGAAAVRAPRAASPEPASGGQSAHLFFLADGGRLRGRLRGPGPGGGGRTVSIETDIDGPRTWTVPLEALAAARFGESVDPAAEGEFQAKRAAREAARDFVVVLGPDRPVVLTGVLEAMLEDKIEFRFGQQTRTIPLNQAYGVVLGTGAAAARRCRVTLRTRAGDSFTTEIASADAERLLLETCAAGQRELPWSKVDQLDLASSRVVHLDDMNPDTVDLESSLDLEWPIQRGRSVTGRPIQLGGRVHPRGIGVHATTRLTFACNGGFERFMATIGVDDAVKPRGSVIFRVLGDGKKLYESPLMRGGAPPIAISVDIRGVRMLLLEADASEGLDLSDHANWADARFIRTASAATRSAS